MATIPRIAPAPRIRLPRRVGGAAQTNIVGGRVAIPDLSSQAGRASATPKPAPTLQQQAQGELQPILQRITDAINLRAKNAGQAITGYTNSLAQTLGQTNYAAPYAPAIQQQAGVDSALAQALSGQGLSDAQGLQARLAQIGEPGVVDKAAQAVQGNATGNSNAVLAGGSANLGALIANQAAAGAYGAKQPGIARLAGLQGLAGANQKAQTDIADQTAQVETQLPNVLNALRSFQATQSQNAATNAYRKQTLAETRAYHGATAQANDLKTKAALIISTNIDPATGQLTPAGAAQLKALGISGSGVAGSAGASVIRGNETASHNKVTEQQGAARVAIAASRASTSAAQGDARIRQGEERLGIARRSTALREKAAREKKLKGGISATTYSGLKKQALKAADLFYYGKQPTASGSGGIPGIDYTQALKELVNGYSLTRADAIEILNDFYAPGERGRSATGIQAKTPAEGGSGPLRP